MRIYTTALLLTCTVLLCTAFEALALPTFTITNVKHACGGQMNGSFTIRVTAANPGALRIRVIGVAPFVDIDQTITPTPGLPFDFNVNNVPGAVGGGAQSYVVIVSDPANRTDFVDIYDFTVVHESTVDNVDPGCAAPTGAINVRTDGSSAAGAIQYTWTGPGGPYFTEDISGLAGGDYSLSYTDGTTTCTLGPFHINDPTPPAFTISTTSPPTICFGQSVQVDVSTTGTAYTYRVVDGASVVSAATPGTGGAISINVPGLAVGPHTLRVEAFAGTCPPKFNDAPNITITVSDVPVYNTTTVAAICSETPLGAAVNLNNFRNGGSVTATQFTIQAVRPGVLVPAAGNPTQTGGPFTASVLEDDEWTNESAGSVEAVEYDIIPSTATCIGVVFTITVPVQPQPKYDDFSNTAPGICSRDFVGVMLDPRVNGASFVADKYNIKDIQSGALTIAGGSPTFPVNGVASNEISDDQWQNVTDQPIDVVYTIEPVSDNDCVGDEFFVTVRINPQPDYNDLTDLVGVCSGEQLNINLDDRQKPNTIAATQFDITVNPNGLTLAGGGPADGLNLPATSLLDDVWKNTTAGDVNVVYDIIPHIGATCVGNPFKIIIAIKPEPVYVDQLIPVCSDTPTNYNLLTAYSAGAAATTFNITITPNGLTPKAGSPADGNGLPSTEIVNDVWENLTANPVDVFYDIVPISAANCEGAPFRVTIRVLPEPDFKNYADDNAPAGICSGDVIGLNLGTLIETTSVAASTYEITSIVTSDPALTHVGAPPSGAGLPETVLMTEAWNNASASNQTVTYHIIPYNGTCKGDEFTVLVTYVPRPSYHDDNTLTGASGICAVPVGIDLNNLVNVGSPLATKFDISVSAPGLMIAAGGPAGGIGVTNTAIADDVWSNTTASNVDVEYTITPYNGNCASLTTFKVTVTIKPQPNYSSTTLPVCSDIPFAVSLIPLRVGGSAVATSFTVAIAADPLLVNTATTPMAPGPTTNPVVGDKWQNRQTTALDVVYTITPFVGACPGASFDVRVTINPEPVYATPTTPAPVICSEDLVNIDLSDFYSAGETATTFDISASSVPAGLTPVGFTAFTASGNKDIIGDDQWRNVTNAAKDIVYTVTPTSALGCAGLPFQVTVTISPQPDYIDFPVNNICSGAAIGLDLDDGVGGSSVLATSYTVLSITAPSLTAVVPAAPRTFPFDVATGDLATDVWRNLSPTSQTAVYRVVPKTGTCAGDFFEVTVTVIPEPIYTTYTNTVVGVCSNLPIGVDLTGQRDLSGTAATTFRIVSVDFTDLTASTNANSAPGIITAGDLVNDQWINVQSGVRNVTYRIVPINGSCEGAEFQVIVAINPEPVGAPFSKDICSDVSANVDLQADVLSLGNNVASNFQWIATLDNPNVANESLVARNTSVINDILTNTSTTVQQVQYTVTPTSSANCVGSSFTVTVNIYPKPVIDPAQVVPNICQNTSVNYSIKMLPPGLPAGTTLEWADPDGPGPAQASPVGGVPLGALGTIHITDVLTAVGSVTYHVIPKVAAGTCSGDPVDITVTVEEAATVEAGPDVTICTDNGPYTLGGSSVGGSVTMGRWTIVSEPAVSDANLPLEGVFLANPAIAAATFSATEPGDYVLMLETEDPAGVCAPMSDLVTISIIAKPVLDTNPPKLICGNEPANYSIALTPAGLPLNTVFEWADPDGPSGPRNASASPVGGVPMGASGTFHITDILKNTTTINQDVVYEVIPRVGLCVGAMKQITITVKPSPAVLFGQTKTICSGEAVNMEILLDPPNTPAGTTFSWPDPDGAGPATSKQDIAAGGPGTIHITDVLFNSTGAAAPPVNYDVISRGANGCFGDTRTVSITVNPGASAEAGNTQTICSGATATLTGASIGGAADGIWDIVTNPGDGDLSVDIATTTPDQVTFTATIGGTYELRLTSGTPAVGSCGTVSDRVFIIVKAAGDPSCTGTGGPIGCPTDVVLNTTNATCNNTDGGVEFVITPALPPSGDVKITVDGPTSKVQFASVDGLVFTNLAVGRYTYLIEYGTCSNDGFFDIDRSGTVGEVTSDQVEDPDCFGGTGSAIINAVNQTGNILEWSNNGTTWTSFLAGTRVDGLPNGTNMILVRRTGDACSSTTTITIANPVEITATFAPTDATCNNNDGAIVVSGLTGGTGPYTYTLNDVARNLPANNTFGGLTANTYIIKVTDSKSCVKTFNPVLVSFPGFVNTTAPVTTAPDCTSGGTNGKVEFTITDPGSFEFAVTSDPVVPPTSYNPLGGSTVSVNNLAYGDYSIWLRPTGSGLKCATKVPVSIRGIYTVSYTATTSDVKCFSEPTSIVLDNIKGAPALPFSYTLTNTADNSVTTGTISASQALSAFSIVNVSPGSYSVLLTQNQSSLVSACTAAISGGAKALVINGPKASLDSLYVDRKISFPDLPSGSAVVGVAPSGLDPYETRLELTDPLFAGQEFASDWSQVTVNPLNLKYEKQYSNLFAGGYTLGIRDAGGCERTYVFVLNVDTNIFIPNIFTPNGDGHNEVFYIRNLPDDSKLLITNRWGKEIFKSSSYQNDWNGGDTVDGTYYYTLTLGSQSYSGWVEILRGQ